MENPNQQKGRKSRDVRAATQAVRKKSSAAAASGNTSSRGKQQATASPKAGTGKHTAKPSAGKQGARVHRSAGAKPAAKRTSQHRQSAGHRKRSSRLRRKQHLWIGVGGFVVVVLAVILALTLPGGESKETASVSPVNPLVTDPADAVVSAGPSAMPTNVPVYEVREDYPNTLAPLGLPECARVDDSYFDDAVFVGDSVTLKLQQYVLAARKGDQPQLLGEAKFLAAQNFGTRNALAEISETSIHPVIGGIKMTLEDAIAQLGAKKLYIMLGMNDVGISGIDQAVVYMGQLLERIQEKSPGIKIFVESVTPRVRGTHPTTNQIFVYDVRLYDAILEHNDPDIYFVDVAYVMRNKKGRLYEKYCSDLDAMSLHFSDEGCRRWIDYLYTHALA